MQIVLISNFTIALKLRRSTWPEHFEYKSSESIKPLDMSDSKNKSLLDLSRRVTEEIYIALVCKELSALEYMRLGGVMKFEEWDEGRMYVDITLYTKPQSSRQSRKPRSCSGSSMQKKRPLA